MHKMQFKTLGQYGAYMLHIWKKLRQRNAVSESWSQTNTFIAYKAKRITEPSYGDVIGCGWMGLLKII